MRRSENLEIGSSPTAESTGEVRPGRKFGYTIGQVTRGRVANRSRNGMGRRGKGLQELPQSWNAVVFQWLEGY